MGAINGKGILRGPAKFYIPKKILETSYNYCVSAIRSIILTHH